MQIGMEKAGTNFQARPVPALEGWLGPWHIRADIDSLTDPQGFAVL